MEITIRETHPSEAEELIEIQKAAFLPLYEKYHDPGNPCLRGVEDILIRLNENYRHFTILADGKIVGAIFYRVHGKWFPDTFLEDGEYYLGRLYIHPDHQGKGIAPKAIKLAEKQFPDAKRFYVDFPADMDKNRRCYEKAGYSDMNLSLQVEQNLTLTFYKKEIRK